MIEDDEDDLLRLARDLFGPKPPAGCVEQLAAFFRALDARVARQRQAQAAHFGGGTGERHHWQSEGF